MSKNSKNSNETAVDVYDENKGKARSRKVFSPKNVIILILLIATVISISIATSEVKNSKGLQEDIDMMFIQTYNELIINSRNRNLAYDTADFTPYDIQNATKTRLLISIFPETSFRENDHLGDLLDLLNDYIGEERKYPRVPYEELSDKLYDDLFELSRDFSNNKKAKLVLSALKGAIGAK